MRVPQFLVRVETPTGLKTFWSCAGFLVVDTKEGWAKGLPAQQELVSIPDGSLDGFGVCNRALWDRHLHFEWWLKEDSDSLKVKSEEAHFVRVIGNSVTAMPGAHQKLVVDTQANWDQHVHTYAPVLYRVPFFTPGATIEEWRNS